MKKNAFTSMLIIMFISAMPLSAQKLSKQAQEQEDSHRLYWLTSLGLPQLVDVGFGFESPIFCASLSVPLWAPFYWSSFNPDTGLSILDTGWHWTHYFRLEVGVPLSYRSPGSIILEAVMQHSFQEEFLNHYGLQIEFVLNPGFSLEMGLVYVPSSFVPVFPTFALELRTQ